MTTSVAEPGQRRERARVAWFALAVAAIAAMPFLPALSAGFVRWDDDKNFLANTAYRGLGLAQLK